MVVGRIAIAAALCCDFAVGAASLRHGKRVVAPSVGQVIVVKRVGIRAYEEAIEEFTERCRVHVSIMTAADAAERPEAKDAKLFVTVGQSAFDALKDRDATVIPIYAFNGDVAHWSPQIDPELPLGLLRRAYPHAKTLALVSGPRSLAVHEAFVKAAERLQFKLVEIHASTGEKAVHDLSLLDAHAAAIVLLPDFDVITPQLFQLALRIQLEKKIPIVASTRQQVHSGALFAYDFSPRALGRYAANRVNNLLANQLGAKPEPLEPELSFNPKAAARLGLAATLFKPTKGAR